MEIRGAANGYIIVDSNGREHLFLSLDDALNYILLIFEGIAPKFQDGGWGQVKIERASDKQQEKQE